MNWAINCFYQYANHLPNHLLSIELKYPDFFSPLFDFLRFILFYFVQTEFLYGNIRFQKEKTSRKRCVYNHGNLYLFRFTYAYMQLLFNRWISLETKMSILNSQMLAFLGTLFVLAIKILKAKLLTFHSSVLMRESYE